MKIDSHSGFYSICYIIVSAILSFILFSLSGTDIFMLKALGYISFIVLLLFFVTTKLETKKYVNFSNIFTLILYIFNFGQIVLLTFFNSVYSHIRFLLLLNSDDALYGFEWLYLAFLMITYGQTIACSISKEHIIPKKDKDKNEKYNLQKLAEIVIGITFPVKVIIDLLCLYYSIKNGGSYARAWLNSFPNVLLYYGKISLVGFGMLIFLWKDRPKNQKMIFIFIETYILLMMVSGIRSENVGYLVIFAFIYFLRKEKKTSMMKFLLFGVFAFLALTLVVTVGSFRGSTEKSIFLFFRMFTYYLTEENVIFSLLDTCGDTGYTALCVITKWLPNYSISYGNAYFLGVFAIIPNIPGIFTLPGKITQASCFTLKLQEAGTLSSSYTNIGGSLIGELFFNFGLLGGLLFALIVGIIVGVINNGFSNCSKYNNYYGSIKFIPAMFACTYWVRDYFGGGIREAVWGPLFVLLILWLFKKYLVIKKQMRSGNYGKQHNIYI